MNRPRKKGNRDYPEGLYPPSTDGRCFRIRHPLTGKFASLKTKDEDTARKLHSVLYPRLLEEKLRHQADELQRQIVALGGVKAGTVADLATEMIGLIPKLTKKNGKPLSDSVKASYRIILTNIVGHDFGQTPVSAFADLDDGPRLVRAFLKPSLDTPSWYNTQLGVLSRLFARGVDKGDLARNPCDPVKSLHTPKREVYMPDEAYVAITGKLAEDWHEVYAKCCDLIYLLSSRNTDALTLEESQIGEGRISFTAAKNEADIDMDMNEDLLALIEWFRAYKRREGIVHPRLCVHPLRRASAVTLTVAEAKGMTDAAIADRLGISNVAWAKRVKRYGLAEALAMGGKDKRYACSRTLAGKPITNAHLRDRFEDAKAAAGYGDADYTLRDLRAKGLTDEAKLKGEATNKGGWKPGSKMPETYVKVRLPIRTANNLRTLRKG